MDEHRRFLVEAIQVASGNYDKAVMTLSGGALVVSIAFVRDIAPNPTFLCLLISAWVLFIISLAAITGSFVSSEAALRAAIREIDEDRQTPVPGGRATQATTVLNVVAGIALVLGAILLTLFATLNLPGR